MFPGKVVLKLLCVKNVNYTFLLFPNYLVFIDFCLKADSWIWKIFTHANEGQTTWLDSAFFLICACPHCVLGLGSNKDQRLILLMTRYALLEGYSILIYCDWQSFRNYVEFIQLKKS